MSIVISSGHGELIRGASGYIDEVDEARRVVNKVAELLGSGATVFHDDVSTSQSENLNRIVNFHNSQSRDLDLSIHFNAYQTTDNPMGTECLYLTQATLAETVAAKVSDAGRFINRGKKKRTDLFFLNKTEMPSILLEVCFVDSKADVDLYDMHFEAICVAISEATRGKTELPLQPKLFVRGKISTFGGPLDTGVAPDEGLALIEPPDLDEWWFDRLFLTLQPPATTGLARRLNPDAFYLAMRWEDYGIDRETARRATFKITNPKNNEFRYAQGSDFGPADWTNRVADLSPGIATALGLETDEEAIIEMV